MSVCVLMLACLTILHRSYVECLNDFLRTYDVVDVEIIDHRVKRSSLEAAYANTSDSKNLQIQFTAFKKKFHLLLSEDSSFLETPVYSYISRNFTENTNYPRAKFYNGNLKNDSLNSSVFGYILDGLFTGLISGRDDVYFIEPANMHFDDMPPESKKMVVYRSGDIRPLQWTVSPRHPKTIPLWKILSRSPAIALNLTARNSGLNFTNRGSDLFCEIEIVADHTLYNFFKNSTDKLTAVLYYHAKFADYIFRKTDFDMDGNLDGVRIAVGKISIYKSAEDENYPMLVAPTLTDYLSLFVSRTQNPRFCLSIGLLYRNYSGTAIGEAVKPHSRLEEPFGGICDPPLHNKEFGALSFNTGVINMRYENGRPLPIAVTLLALTHEIGHGFGSDHDPVDNPECSPGKLDHYLMYPFASYGSSNTMKFSPCSRRDIWKILTAKGGCLKSRNSTCGNGIREGKEECDCGSDISCNLIDPCCTPSDAKPPEKPCAIRTGWNFKCSPKESECCGKNCVPVTDKQTLCYSDITLCLFSFCDGYSSICPKPQKVPDFCRGTFVCDEATCSNVTLCETLGLHDCLCQKPTSTNCLQCCQVKSECTPASKLGVVRASGKPFILQAGTKCDGGRSICDNSGNCLAGVRHVPTSLSLYLGVIIIPFFVSLLLIIAMFSSFQEMIQSPPAQNDISM